MTVIDLLRVLRRRIVWAAGVFIAVLLFVMVYLMAAPKIYTASADTFASYVPAAGSTADAGTMNAGTAYLSTQIKSYPELVKSQAVLDPVIKRLSLRTTTQQLANSISASNPTNTYVIRISAKAHSAELAASIANATAESLSKQISGDLYAGQSSAQAHIALMLSSTANVPSAPSSPRVKLYLGAGFIVGIVAAIATALVVDGCDGRLNKYDNDESYGNSPIIGNLSKTKSAESTEPAVVVKQDSAESTQVRNLKTDICTLVKSQKNKGTGEIIAFTSPTHDGDSGVVALDVAAAIAEDQKRVLYVDANLKRATLEDRLGIESDGGLAEILLGKTTPMKVVRPYWKSTFHILGTGRQTSDARYLLGSKTMTELLAQAAQSYDYIIIKAMPFDESHDAVSLVGDTGAIVVAATVGKTKKKDLRHCLEQMKTLRAPVIGVVLN